MTDLKRIEPWKCVVCQRNLELRARSVVACATGGAEERNECFCPGCQREVMLLRSNGAQA